MQTKAVLTAVLVLFALTSCTAPQPVAENKPAAPAMQIQGNLVQLMRGVMYPSSNVIFAAQSDDPSKLPPAKDPSTATDPLLSTYGGWTAVENAGISLAESANLLLIPGRKCANGKDMPLNNPDWPQLVQGLRDAGMKAYEAGKSKNNDKVLEAADVMSTACANCHDKYRDKGNDADRCM